jgi:diamine N-acetyltransferase
MIKGENISLRAPEPEDLDFMLDCENSRENWLVSETIKPFSRNTLRNYLLSAQSIEDYKQIRWVAENEKNAVGILDFFDWDKQNQRIGIGIWVSPNERGKGIGEEMLKLGSEYAFSTLMTNQIYAHILSNNKESEKLFQKAGYSKSGTKEAWIRFQNSWLDQHIYQKLNNG